MLREFKPTGNIKIAAVILTAGLSQRMNAFKPLLELAGRSALQRCLDLFKEIEVETTVVVSGYHHEKLTDVVAGSNAVQVINPNYKEGMFSSITVGVKALQEGLDAFFILPVDIPLIRRATAAAILHKFIQFKPMVCYPVFGKRRGHPPLISTRLIPEIVGWEGPGGLAGFLRRMERRAVDVPVADQTILMDMDTPDDYRVLQKRAENYGIPTKEECRALMQDVYPVTPSIKAHCKMVARVAVGLGDALNKKGSDFNLNLLESAAMVHDLARSQNRHASAGARLLNHWNFDAVAPLVAEHMDLIVKPEVVLDEIQLLYLADKLVGEDRLVDLDQRFQIKLDHYGNNQDAANRIRTRWQTADSIRKKIESATKLTLDRILLSIFETKR